MVICTLQINQYQLISNTRATGRPLHCTIVYIYIIKKNNFKLTPEASNYKNGTNYCKYKLINFIDNFNFHAKDTNKIKIIES